MMISLLITEVSRVTMTVCGASETLSHKTGLDKKQRCNCGLAGSLGQITPFL